MEAVLPRIFFSMAVILKGKLVLQYEKNSKINILSDNFRVFDIVKKNKFICGGCIIFFTSVESSYEMR